MNFTDMETHCVVLEIRLPVEFRYLQMIMKIKTKNKLPTNEDVKRIGKA